MPVWAYGSNLLGTGVQCAGESAEQVSQTAILSDELSVYYGKAEVRRSTQNHCFRFHFKAISASLVRSMAFIYADDPSGG